MQLNKQEIDSLFEKVSPNIPIFHLLSDLEISIAKIAFREGYRTALEGYQQVPALLKGKPLNDQTN